MAIQSHFPTKDQAKEKLIDLIHARPEEVTEPAIDPLVVIILATSLLPTYDLSLKGLRE